MNVCKALGADAASVAASLAIHRNSGDRSSLSSVSLKGDNPLKTSSSKPPKSLMKCHRTVDPKLRIRPFRSKVTFSDDTKAGDNSPEKRVHLVDGSSGSKAFGNFFNLMDSSSDSVSSGLLKPGDDFQGQPISLKRHHTFSESSATPSNARRNSTMLKVSDIPFADLSKRRQSFDPSIAAKLAVKPLVEEELNKDNWLHYQSLPNIQEEDQGSQQTSPTETSPPKEAFSGSIPLSPTISVPTAVHLPTATFPVRILTPPTPSPPPYSKPVTNVLLPPQPATPPLSGGTLASDAQQAWKDGGRRRSLKRQKSQDVPDDKMFPAPPKSSLPPLSSCPPTTVRTLYSSLNKQSSDESQTSNSSSSTNQLKQPQGPGVLYRARNKEADLKPRQASTESDTASWHTVNSYKMQSMEKSNSSSIDSFTSANSESNNNNSSSNGNGISSTRDETLDRTSAVENSNLNGSPRSYHDHHLIHESSLVPTIIFSQSTPSVTSQSSDDQNSPKWDDRGGSQDRFTSLETVLEAKQNAQRAAQPQGPSSDDHSQPSSSGSVPGKVQAIRVNHNTAGNGNDHQS